jgi:hypothetical protein
VRRWVLLLIALAIAAGPVAFAAPASADDVCGGQGGPCFAVTVVGENQPPKYLPWSDFDKMTGVQNGNNCAVRSKPGTAEFEGCNPASPGISIQTLLADASIPIAAVKLLQVSESGSTPSTLTADELATDPSPFENNWVPAFGLFGGGILFNRPLLNNPNDTNAGEDVTTPAGGEMDVVVYPSATVLHPTVQVPAEVTAGVSFTAQAVLPPGEVTPGVTYTYIWNFYYGPADAEPARTTHKYPVGTNGTYGVSVTVEHYVGTTLSAYGTSQPVVVPVGAPAKTPPAKGPPGGSGTGKKHHPTVGPNKGKGRQPGGAPGKKGGTGRTTATPSSSATQPTPASDAATPTSGPTGGASTVRTGPTSAPSATAGATGRHHRSTPPAGANFGALVQGVVIDSAARPVAAAPAPTARAATAESARRRSAQPFDARLLWWLLLPVLLGLGVLSEVRRPRPRRAPNA